MSSIANINDAYSWNITRIAEAFDFSRDTVRKRLRIAGVRPCGKRSGNDVYSLAEIGPALFIADGYQDVPEMHDPDKMPPKDRKEWFHSERIRVDLERDQKQLIHEGEHRQDLYDGFSQVVSFFENLPDKMERTGQFTPEQLELLEQYGDGFRNELYTKVKEVEPDADS